MMDKEKIAREIAKDAEYQYCDDVYDAAYESALEALSHAEKEIEGSVILIKDVASSLLDSLVSLREADVFIWPNHPLNPEDALRKALNGAGE